MLDFNVKLTFYSFNNFSFISYHNYLSFQKFLDLSFFPFFSPIESICFPSLSKGVCTLSLDFLLVI
jgi:hypothetical protein